MFIPEITIYKLINTFIKLAATDYNDAPGDKSTSILYNIFKTDDNGEQMVMEGKDDYYKMAVELFGRTEDKVNQLQLNIGYNLQRAAEYPTIHILLPSENKGRIDTLGNNQGADPGNTMLNGVLSINKTRSKSAVYNLMITSPNIYEVLIIYYFLHAMLLIFDDNSEFKGLRNMNMSGQDLITQSDLSLPNVFHRNLTMQFDYEYSVKVQVLQTLIGSFGFAVCADFALDNK